MEKISLFDENATNTLAYYSRKTLNAKKGLQLKNNCVVSSSVCNIIILWLNGRLEGTVFIRLGCYKHTSLSVQRH